LFEEHSAENNTDNKVQFIRVSSNKRSSFHNINENRGFYSTNDDLQNSTTASHEGAHGFGLNHTQGSNSKTKTRPNIITPRGTKVLPKWSRGGKTKNGINPYLRTWSNSLVKKILDQVMVKVEVQEKLRIKYINQMERKGVCGTKSKTYFNFILKTLVGIFILISCSREREIKPFYSWINDKYGCKGYRNIELAKSAVSKNEMINNSSESDVVKIFGEADLVEGNLLNKELFYLSNSNCENGTIIKESDKCYIVFTFELNKLKSISELCE
jgi:hypothetical protein